MTTHIQREAINPPGMWSSRPSSPASAAIKVGNLVFISGQVALDKDGRVVGKDDIRAQSQHVFQALKTILEEAGSGLDGLVKITTFLTDSAHYAAEKRDPEQVHAAATPRQHHSSGQADRTGPRLADRRGRGCSSLVFGEAMSRVRSWYEHCSAHRGPPLFPLGLVKRLVNLVQRVVVDTILWYGTLLWFLTSVSITRGSRLGRYIDEPIIFFPRSSVDGSKATVCPGTMLPISTKVPPLVRNSIPSKSNSARPTNSITMFAPRPSVSCHTRSSRASGVFHSSMLIV